MEKRITLIKTIFFFTFLVIGMFGNVKAVTTIKVGSADDVTNLVADYSSIQAAYNSIATPVADAYVIELQSGYDPTTETYPITFAAKSGASLTNNITLKPATGVNKTLSNPMATVVKTGLTTTVAPTVDVLDATGISLGMYVFGTATNTSVGFPTVTAISGSIVTAGTTNFTAKTGASLYFGPKGTKTIVFTGATYVTIDGVSRTYENTGLTIQNPNNIVARTLSFEGSSYNTIKNCFIKGANISGDAYNDGKNGMIFFSGTSNYNTIENNNICDIDGSIMPINMFMFNNTGGSTDATIYNTIQNNNIYNFGSTTATPVGNAGCFNFPSSVSPNTWILNNRIYWTKTVPALSTAGNNTFFIIGFGGTSSGKLSRIEGNFIGGTSDDGTGTVNFTPATSTAITVINVLGNSTVKNNTIFGFSSSLTVGFNGIAIGNAYPNADAGDITGNTIHDITVSNGANNAEIKGISCTWAVATPSRNVTNNTIYNLTSSGSSIGNRMLIRGIYMLGTCTSNSNFSGNRINNINAGSITSTANNFVIGMDLQLYSSVVERNFIYNLKTIGTSTTLTRTVYGIRTSGSNNVLYGGVTGMQIRNNLISLGSNMTNSPDIIYGIYQSAATSTSDPIKIYNNSVYIGGSANSSATIATSTYAFFRTGTIPVNDIRNNIFSNQRAINGGTANQYAISVATLADLATCTKNLYQYNGKLAAIATGSTTTYTDLTAWSNARTAASLTADASIDNTDPVFMDPTPALSTTLPDLRIKMNATVVDQAGADLSALVTDDYYGNTRSGLTPHDIGAYAYTVTTPASTATDYFKTNASGNWDSNATWQSSANNSDWITATAYPSGSATNVIIQNGHLVTTTANVTTAATTINGGGQLTLNSGSSLLAANLTLESHPINGTATIKDLNTTGGLTVSGTTNVEQYLTTGRNWYISSPVASATSNVFGAASSSTNKLWSYSEATGTSAPWPQITNNSTSLVVGKGYVANMPASGVVTFTGGALNTGSITTGVNGVTTLTRTAGQAKEGFNLVGNPYPSFLNWSSVTKTNVNPTMWYRTNVGGTYKFYTYLDGEGALEEDGITIPAGVSSFIPPMQAFWVRVANGQSTGTLAFANTMRAHKDISGNSLKAPSERKTTLPLLRLQVSNGVNDDEAVIYFSENVSNGFDRFDATKMSHGNNAIPEIYTLAGNEQLAINGLNSIDTNREITLGFVTGNAGSNFSIAATEVRNMGDDTRIVLVDKLANKETDITEGTTYTFASDAVNTVNQFSVIFRTSGMTTELNGLNKSNARVFVNADNQITIVAHEKSAYSIFNVLGQMLLNGVTTSDQTTANIRLQSGIYVVNVAGNQSTKVIIK